MGNIRIHLKANEKIFINGAILKSDRKVSFELLNDVTFLLESHVMKKEEVDTPIKQLYYIVQMMLMHPEEIDRSITLFESLKQNILSGKVSQKFKADLNKVDAEVLSGRYFTGLKMIRGLITIDAENTLADCELISNRSSRNIRENDTILEKQMALG